MMQDDKLKTQIFRFESLTAAQKSRVESAEEQKAHLLKELAKIDDDIKKRNDSVVEEAKALIRGIAETAGIEVYFEETDFLNFEEVKHYKKRVAKHYQHPDTKVIWRGVGPIPGWLKDLESKGRKRTEFLIQTDN